MFQAAGDVISLNCAVKAYHYFLFVLRLVFQMKHLMPRRPLKDLKKIG
jgi:hypothetical protein